MNFMEQRAKQEAAWNYAATRHIKEAAARRAGLDALEAAEDRGATDDECKAAYWAAHNAIMEA